MTEHPLRVLCVDDDPDIRTIALMALELDPDLELRAASGGEEALSILRKGDWSPDIVLLDVMMPGLEGPEVLKAMRREAATMATPVVFMTARARREDVEGYLALGAAGVISKPFDPLNLAGELRRLVARTA